MEAMRRRLVWVKKETFQGWACSECAWAFKPIGPLVGESMGEMMQHYEQQRDREFAAHVCAEHPRTTRTPL